MAAIFKARYTTSGDTICDDHRCAILDEEQGQGTRPRDVVHQEGQRLVFRERGGSEIDPGDQFPDERAREDSLLTVISASDYPAPPEVKKLAEETRRTSGRHEDLLAPKAIRDRFEGVYWNVGVPSRMIAYPLGDRHFSWQARF